MWILTGGLLLKLGGIVIAVMVLAAVLATVVVNLLTGGANEKPVATRSSIKK